MGCKGGWILATLIAMTSLALALAPSRAAAGEGPPNVIVVLTDDQEVASLAEMPNVDRLLADQGLTFENSIASFPLCCPSRATLLTGQYAHNHTVLHNNPPTGSISRLNQANTLPIWLQRAGYYTAHVGKYLNYYEQTPAFVPPGWDGWWTLTGCDACRPVDRLAHVYRYYGYRLNENGALVDYGTTQGDYLTDVLSARVSGLIRERAATDQPFFISFDPVAPHGGSPQPSPQPPFDCGGDQVALPAPRHAGAFDDRTLPRPPSFDEEDVSDKPGGIRALPHLTVSQIGEMVTRWRCRLESLLAVDDAVADIVNALAETGELDNTYVIFTSDNGYFFGEHRVPKEKILLYEEAIRVPLVVRGPGFEPGTRTSELVANTDLAATIVGVTGAAPGLPLDGQSLLSAARRPDRERGREVLLETIGATGLRNRRYAYFEHDSGERELYDLERDPYQLESLHLDPGHAEVQALLAARLATLRSCVGAACATLPDLALEPRRGRRCLRRDGTARLLGASVGEVGALKVRLRGVEKTDIAPPFEVRIPVAKLPARRSAGLHAVAELRDGRRWSDATRVRACRGAAGHGG